MEQSDLFPLLQLFILPPSISNHPTELQFQESPDRELHVQIRISHSYVVTFHYVSRQQNLVDWAIYSGYLYHF